MTLDKLRDALISAFSANYRIDIGRFISIIRNNIAIIYSAIDHYRKDISHKYFIISIRFIENNIYDCEYYILRNKRILARFINNTDHNNIIFDTISDNITFNYIASSDINNPTILVTGCDYNIMIGEDKCNIFDNYINRNIILYKYCHE